MNLYVVSFVYAQKEPKKLDLSKGADKLLFTFLEENHELYIYSQDMKTLLNGINNGVASYTVKQLEEFSLYDLFSYNDFNILVFNANLVQHDVEFYRV